MTLAAARGMGLPCGQALCPRVGAVHLSHANAHTRPPIGGKRRSSQRTCTCLTEVMPGSITWYPGSVVELRSAPPLVFGRRKERKSRSD